jgi:2-keto-4-pentenoate hydratase/2-oxohepta-3-ene-1,7-dioic acid hydratase in catechol pathway
MRLVTFLDPKTQRERVGVIDGDRIIDVTPAAASDAAMIDLIAAGAAALPAARDAASGEASGVQLGNVRLLAPIPRPQRNVVCVGLNYSEHVAESKSVVDATPPTSPVFFTKPPSTVIGPDAPIPWHANVSIAIDWEVELAVIIGRECRDVTESTALDVVFGYTVANDVTARDLQQKHQQWYKGKGLDGFCPLGPVIVTADEIPDPQTLDLSLRVNGVEKQRSNTRFQIFSVARLISEWSAGMTLYPGDILLTGTPSGVGVGRTPPEFLKPGDMVEAEVAGIGVLRNTVGATA